MTLLISPPPENIAGVLNKFRTEILTNRFSISPHANERMVSRKINLKELVECVREGQVSRGKVVPDFIGGKFIYKDLCVVVYAPFGEYSALPNVVTVYRDGDEDDISIMDLIDDEALQGQLQAALKKIPTAPPSPRLSDLTDEELEQELLERKTRRAYEQHREQEAKRVKLAERKEFIENEILALSSELDEINRELES